MEIGLRGKSREELSELYSRQIDELTRQLDTLAAHAAESVCGGIDESQDVELYDGTLGVSKQFVSDLESPMGQLKWLDDLHTRFSGPDESAGNVSGQRWGSGGLIAADVFLTAGHCFDAGAGAWGFPTRNGQPLAPRELATSMEVSFKYQVDGASQSKRVRPGDRFPVLDLLEHRLGGLDYALVRLGRNNENQLPGERYGWCQVSSASTLDSGSMLCLIQHPNGQPKRVEAGPMRDNLGGRITYDSLDTSGGSSGSLILHYPTGQVVGVHTNGGCSRLSGFNYGVAIDIIRLASTYLTPPPVKPPPVKPPPPVEPPPVEPPPPVGPPTSSLTWGERMDRLDRVFDAIATALA